MPMDDERIANEECDELLARLKAQRTERRGFDSGLVYRTTMTPPRVLPPDSEATVDDDQWNSWAQAIAHAEATKASNQLVDDLDAFNAVLQKRIADLEARIAVLERADKSAPVIPLRKVSGDAA
jgi:hypothetical protein